MSSDIMTCQRVLSMTVFSGFMIHHMLRINISFAIVEMIVRNNSNITQEDYGPRYNWNEQERNTILGCFFWGYVLTQIPGGRLSEKFGAKFIVGTGFLGASILTLLTPIASHLGYFWLVATRFCMGLCFGVHWPSTPTIATKWVKPVNMATFMSHMTASSLGIAVTLPICGYLIVYWGWSSVFYVTGSIALIWSLCWFYLIYDSPEEHPRISSYEKNKLRREIKSITTSSKKLVPWRKILTSWPVWAFIIANSLSAYTIFVTHTQLPTFMNQNLHFNVETNGWLSSLPFLLRYLVSLFSSVIADKIQATGKLATTTIRKMFSVTFFFSAGCLFTVQAFWGYCALVSIVVFSVTSGLLGLLTAGVYTNVLDISPSFAGSIFVVAQVPLSFAGYIATEAVAFALQEKQEFPQWANVFWTLVATNVFAGVFVLIFTSGNVQSWDNDVEVTDIEQRIV